MIVDFATLVKLKETSANEWPAIAMDSENRTKGHARFLQPTSRETNARTTLLAYWKTYQERVTVTLTQRSGAIKKLTTSRNSVRCIHYGLNNKLPGQDFQKTVWENCQTTKGTNPRLRPKHNPRATRRQFWANWIDTHKDKQNDTKTMVNSLLTAPKHVFDLVTNWKNLSNQLYDIINDLFKYKFDKPKIKKNKGPVFTIRFSHKIMDDICLPRILSLPAVKEQWPSHLQPKLEDYIKPTVAYTYDCPAGVLFCNYKKYILSEYDKTTTETQCGCETSEFCDPYHGHIVTGNIDLIKDQTLKNLFDKGFKYIPHRHLDVRMMIKDLEQGLAEYTKKMAKLFKMDQMEFVPWYNMVKEMFTLNLEKHLVTCQNECDLSNHIWSSLRKFQKQFIITPVDKANNNYGFICKKFYGQLIGKELGASNYLSIEESKQAIIQTLSEDLSSLGLFDPLFTHLPFLYLIPKFHKNPIKFRPIIASKSSITKPLSHKLGLILKCLLRGIRFVDGTFKPLRSSINTCFVIDDNTKILEWIELINSRKKGMSVETYDFENLYTTLDHKDILCKLTKLISTAFKNTNKLIAVSDYNAYWIINNSIHDIFDVKRISVCLRWLLNNAYFVVGNHVFRQDVGIPMGSSCAPFLANLYLYQQEKTYFEKNLLELRFNNPNLTNVFRLIDDITVFNDQSLNLSTNFHKIYNKSLSLKKINTIDNQADVLDLSIKLYNNSFSSCLYDKTKDFNFFCPKFPHYTSCLNINVKTNCIQSQIFRYSRICSHKEALFRCIKDLVDMLRLRGYWDKTIYRTLIKTYYKFRSIGIKFNLTFEHWQSRIQSCLMH